MDLRHGDDGASRGSRRRLSSLGVAGLALLSISAVTVLLHDGIDEPRASAATAEPPLGKPNIVMVIADDMRVDDLRFAPNVRRLVGDSGLTFQNSFASYPLCVPSRATLLTGQHAHNHKVYWHDPPYAYAAFDDSRTIATSLTAAGYRTGLIGKYINGYGPDTSRVSGQPSYRYVPRGWSDWRGSITGPLPGVHGGTYHYFDIPFNANGRIDNSHRGQYSTDVIGNLSVQTATKFARGSKPFFLYVSYVAPHAGSPERGDPPIRAKDSSGKSWKFVSPARPDWVRGRYDDVITRGAGLPRGGGPAEADVSDKPQRYRTLVEPSRRERGWIRDVTRQRAEAVHVVDEQVGRLITRLKRSGEWSNTVFMFTSDNGYYLGEHRLRSGKATPYEPSLRVPFLVTGPGMRSGQDRNDPISGVDVTATILDLADAEPPRRPDGASRVPTMLQGDRGWRTPILTETAIPGSRTHVRGFDDERTSIGVRTARYSFVVNRNGADELYDLVTDPTEDHNVFRDPDHRKVRVALKRVWTQIRNCDGAECRPTLPAVLQADVSEERTWTRAYWSTINRVYGWR